MEVIIDLIKNEFGAKAVTFVAVVIAAFYSVRAVLEVYSGFGDLSGRRVERERRRANLELLKLRCEIEALIKNNSLDNIPTPEHWTKDAEPEPEFKRFRHESKVVIRIVDFLLSRGRFGTFIAAVLFVLARLVGTFLVASALSAIAINVYLSTNANLMNLGMEIVYTISIGVFGAFSYYVSLSFAKRMADTMPALIQAVRVLTAILVALSIVGWFVALQNIRPSKFIS